MKLSKLLFVLFLLTISLPIIFSQFVTVNANPFPTYPNIKINSPTNSTYHSNSLNLGITINTMFDNFTNTDRTISYRLDGKSSIAINDVTYKYFEGNSTSTVTASTLISNLPYGQHEVQVEATYQYAKDISFTSIASVLFFIDVGIGNQSPISSPTPDPSVPEFSWLTILPLLLIISIVLIIARKRLQVNVWH